MTDYDGSPQPDNLDPLDVASPITAMRVMIKNQIGYRKAEKLMAAGLIDAEGNLMDEPDPDFVAADVEAVVDVEVESPADEIEIEVEAVEIQSKEPIHFPAAQLLRFLPMAKKMTCDELAEALGVSKLIAYGLVAFMREIGAVESGDLPKPAGQKGGRATKWYLLTTEGGQKLAAVLEKLANME